jgi:ribosome-binding protein aMBF1 (putative translation factor)
MAHKANPLRERNQPDKAVRALRDIAFRGNTTFAAALRRAKRAPDFAGHDDATIAKTVALWEAKLIAATFIRRARLKAGLSQHQLAQRLNTPRNYITQAESFTNDMKVPLDLLVRIAHITDTPLVLRASAAMTAEEQRHLKPLIDRLPTHK